MVVSSNYNRILICQFDSVIIFLYIRAWITLIGGCNVYVIVNLLDMVTSGLFANTFYMLLKVLLYISVYLYIYKSLLLCTFPLLKIKKLEKA